MSGSAAVQEWAQVPLLLTALVLLNDEAELPTRTVDLYDRLFRRLVERWEEEKHGSAPSLAGGVKRDFLRHLAWELSARGRAEQLDDRIDEERLRDEMRRFLATRDAALSGSLDAQIERLLDALRRRDSALAWTGGRAYRFVHRSLFEYLVAEAFCDPALGRADWTAERLHGLYAERWAETTWRHVLTLLPGLLDEEAAVAALRGIWSALRPFELRRAENALAFTLRCLAERPLALPTTRLLYNALRMILEDLLRDMQPTMVIAALSHGAGRKLPWIDAACIAALTEAEHTREPERFLEFAFAAANASTRLTVLRRGLPRAGRAFLTRWVRRLEALGPWTPQETELLLRHVEGPPPRPDGAISLATSIPETRGIALRSIPDLGADACRLVLHVVSSDDEELVSAVLRRMLDLAIDPNVLQIWGVAHFVRWRGHPLVLEIFTALRVALAATSLDAWSDTHRRWVEFLVAEFQDEVLLAKWRDDIARRLPLRPDGHPPNVVPSMIPLFERWPPSRAAFLEILERCRDEPIPARNAINLVIAASALVSFDEFVAGLHPRNYTIVEDFAHFVEAYRPEGAERFHEMLAQLGRHFNLDATLARRLLVSSLRRLGHDKTTGWVELEVRCLHAETTDIHELVALDSAIREPRTQEALAKLRRTAPVEFSKTLEHLPSLNPAAEPTLIIELEADGSRTAIRQALKLAVRLGDRAALKRLLPRPEFRSEGAKLVRVEPMVLLALLDRVEALLRSTGDETVDPAS